MSDPVRPQRRQPTRLPRPWDSSGKNTGVGCHFLLQCMKVKSESEVARSCPTPSDPIDCSLPGSSVCGICQARGLEWGASYHYYCIYNYYGCCYSDVIKKIFFNWKKIALQCCVGICLQQRESAIGNCKKQRNQRKNTTLSGCHYLLKEEINLISPKRNSGHILRTKSHLLNLIY